MRLPGSAILACLSLSSLCAADAPKFEVDILPVLQRNCVTCHSGAKPQGGLDVQSIEGLLRGGQSGPAIRPGKADGSLIIEKLVSKKMPPTPEKLSDAQIARLRQWIDSSTEFAAPSEADILPVIQMRCVVCHGKRKQEGGLDLRTHAFSSRAARAGLLLYQAIRTAVFC